MTLRKAIERYQRVLETSDDPAHASIAAALREILSEQIGGDAGIDVDIESELRAMLVTMDSTWGAIRSVGRDYSSLAAETNWKRGFKEGWLAAKRDAQGEG